MARDRAARPEARPLRLFVATDVPSEVRQRLADAVRPWHGRVDGARWVSPDNWHVTLKFLGSVYPRLVDWVTDQIRAAARAGEPLTASLSVLGAFPSPRRARVLWAGLEDPSGQFASLAGTLDGLLEREFEPEKRAFTPHLTVARFNQQGPLPDTLLAADVRSEPFPVEHLTLYRSYLQRPAARYEPLGRFPFGG
jgi:RNA 2',3'-cyclic 3'-phosphodiesterase